MNGGGRIVGEGCHFIDTLTFLNGSIVVSVFANVMKHPEKFNDTININLTFENGSIGSICYFSNGDKSLPKERIEIFSNGASAIIEDFKSMIIYSKGKKVKTKLMSQDKGQKEEVYRFINTVKKGIHNDHLIPLKEIYNTSLATFRINESIQTGLPREL